MGSAFAFSTAASKPGPATRGSLSQAITHAALGRPVMRNSTLCFPDRLHVNCRFRAEGALETRR
jgi:hypothetical protein